MPNDFNEEYKNTLIQQRIQGMRKNLGLTEQDQISSVEPTQEVAAQEKYATIPEEVSIEMEDPERSFMQSVGAFLKEIPEQTLGGILDAINNTVDAAGDIGRSAGIPNYGLKFTDKEGNFDLRFVTPEEVEEAGGMRIAPELGGADTVAGDFTRALATFAAGFIPASKALKAAGYASGVARGMVSGGAADLIAMDPHQDRLATLLNQVPVLQDIIPDYMADNDPNNESDWEGRIKNVLEGVVVGGATEGIIKGATGLFKSYKAAKMAPKVPKTAEAIANETEMAAAAKEAAIDDLVQPSDVDLGPEEILTKTPEGKTYFNASRVKSADDIKNVLQNMADQTDLSDTTKTMKGMKNASKDEYKSVADLLGREPNRPFTAEEAVAARDLMTSSANNISEMAKAASDPMASPEQLFQFRRAVEVHKSIQEVVLAGRKATAQSLKSWDIPSTTSKRRSKQIMELMATKGQDARKLATMIADVAEDGGNVSATVGKINRLNLLNDSYYQIWINGKLSAPTTHAVNITGGLGTTIFSIPERYITAAFDAMRGEGGSSITAANGRAVGFFGGLRDGFLLMTGKTKNEQLQTFTKMERPVSAISAENWGKPPDSIIGKGLDYIGKAIELPGWALEKEDLFFKGIAYRMKMQEKAYQIAYQEGLRGQAFRERVADFLKNPPEEIADDAVDFARYQTFTKEAGPIARAVHTLSNVIPGGKFIIPFVRTPANILAYGFERTPLAPLMGDVRRKLLKGGPDSAEAIARISAGSLLMAGVVPWVLDGRISGAGPSDWKQRQILEETGWQPYSIKIGGTWHSYERLEPIATLIGYSADLTSIMGQLEEDESGELVAAGLAAFSRNLTNKQFISGASDLNNVIQSNSPNKWENYLSRMAAGFIQPVYSSGLMRVSNYFDNERKDFRSDDVNGFLKSTMMRTMNTIPGYSPDAPPLRDVWGEPQTYTNGIAGPLEVISPIKISKDKQDPVSDMVAENDIAIGHSPRTINGVKLTNKEYSRYCEIAGKTAKKRLDQLYDRGIFDNKTPGPEGTIALIIDKVIYNSRKYARQKLIMESPELQDRIYNAKREKQAKLMGEM